MAIYVFKATYFFSLENSLIKTLFLFATLLLLPMQLKVKTLLLCFNQPNDNAKLKNESFSTSF